MNVSGLWFQVFVCYCTLLIIDIYSGLCFVIPALFPFKEHLNQHPWGWEWAGAVMGVKCQPHLEDFSSYELVTGFTLYSELNLVVPLTVGNAVPER